MPSSASPTIEVLPQGAVLHKFLVPSSAVSSGVQNVVLSLPSPKHYKDHNPAYIGETIGRTTNRIAGATVHNLNGRDYSLFPNETLPGSDSRGNCHHGGREGWGKKVWRGPAPELRRASDGRERESVKFSYVSRDGEEGFPGTVEARVWYTAYTEESVDTPTSTPTMTTTVLEIEHEIEFTGDECEETIASLTNHSYFTLSPNPPPYLSSSSSSSSSSSAETQPARFISLATSQYLPTDSTTHIPTGAITPHPALGESYKPFTPIPITSTAPVLDDCFILQPFNSSSSTPLPTPIPLDTRNSELRKAVILSNNNTIPTASPNDQPSERPTDASNLGGGVQSVEIYTTEPALQIYTADGLSVPPDPEADNFKGYGSRAGIAIEPGRYTDAQREEGGWRGMVLLRRRRGDGTGSGGEEEKEKEKGEGSVAGSRSVYRVTSS